MSTKDLVNQLKDLPPEERIKKLKELEKKKEQEVKEAKNLIKKAAQELADERKKKEKVPIREFAKDDTAGLSKEAEEILKREKGIKEDESADEEQQDTLEETLAAEMGEELKQQQRQEQQEQQGVQYAMPPAGQQEVYREYVIQASYTPVQELQEEMKSLYENVQKKGYMSHEEQQRVDQVMAGLEEKMQSGTYTFSERVAQKASLIQQLGSAMRDVYKTQKKVGDEYRMS